MDDFPNSHDPVTISRRTMVGSAVGLTVLALPTAHVSASGVESSGNTGPAGGDFEVGMTSVTTNTSGGATVEFF